MNPNEQNQQPPQPVAVPFAQPQPQPVAPQAPQTSAQPVMPPLPEMQPAAAAPQKSITIKFEEDLQFQITAEKIDDMRFMDLYAEVSEDELKIPKLMRFLLGAAEYDSIFTYYESKGQRFSITKFGQVFEKLDKDLNSQPDFLRG